VTDDEAGWPAARDRAEALAWADERLAGRRAGDVREVRRTAWSWVVRVPLVDGTAWLKATHGGARYEAALTATLAGLVPDSVLVPLAVQPDRAWALFPDGGPTLRAAETAPDPRRWELFLQGYASLQRAVSAKVGDLLAAGTPDMRPDVMPARLAAFLADPPADLSLDVHGRLVALRAEYTGWASALAEGGIAASIQHDDLHDANVLVDGDRYRFFDWGDASVAHPFASLLVTLRVAAYKFGVPAGDPLVLRLRDAYLEAWSGEHDGAHLREQARLATAVAKVARAAAWQRALAGAGPAALAEDGDAVSGWLGEVLEHGPL
jgi:hypothetical protein